MSLMCYQASVPGTSHLALGIPNQDSFAVRIVRSGWSSTCVAPGGTRVRRVRGDEFVVAAVADGLGSAELSDLGSAAAATAAVEALSLSAATYPGLAGIDDLKLEGPIPPRWRRPSPCASGMAIAWPGPALGTPASWASSRMGTTPSAAWTEPGIATRSSP